MKKLLLISALMATAVAATAETTLIGVDGKTSQLGNPIHPGYAHSGAQCLYTNAELNSIYSVAADGTITTAEISAITFYIYVNDVSYVYNNGGDFSVTAYAQNVDDTAFAFNEANKPVMFDYSSAAQAHGEIKADAIMDQELGDEWSAVFSAMEPSLVPVTVTFDEPFKYEGKSLVLTFACESSATDIGLSVGENAGWAPGSYIRSLIYHSNSQSMATDYTYSDKYLPNLTLDYNVVTEKPAPSVVEGDPTTFTVGDFDDPDLEAVQSGVATPITLDYNYSYSQAIYTKAMLDALYGNDGSNAKSAKITSLAFAIDPYYEMYTISGDFEVEVYAFISDATSFPVDGGKSQWFTFDVNDPNVHHGKVISSDDAGWNEYLEDVESNYYSEMRPKITVQFDEPFEYAGEGSLIVAWTCKLDGFEFEGSGSNFLEYSVCTSGSYSATKASSSELGIPTGSIGSNPDKYVPVIEIGYTPLTQQSSAQVATIGDVSVSVRQVACEPKPSLNSEANVLEFSFEITDPANVGSYDVTLNSVNLGTVTGNFVQISFVNPNPAQDYVIGITPKAEGVVGNTATVTKELIAGLFETPAVEVTDWHLLSNYNATADKASVSASFVCTVTGIDGFAARYSNDDWCSSLGNGRVGLWGAQAYANDIPDFLAALQPATATADNFNALKANDYKFAIAKMNWLENVAVTDAELAPISERIYFKSTITQPVAYLIIPTLGAAPESINGNSYKVYDFTTTVSVSATLTSADDHLQANVTFPEALEIKVDKSNSRIVVYAPEGSSLWYRIVEITDEAEDTPAPLLMAEGVWQQAPTNPWSIGKDDLAFDAIIELKIVTGGIESPVTSMVIKQSGEVASAATIEADNADAVRYFTPMGVEIAPEAITPGTLYIRRTATGATKHLAR